MAESLSASRANAAVVISTDADFRETLASTLDQDEGEMEVALEIDAPYPEIGDRQLEEIRQLDPSVIFLDLESEPEVGLRFAQFLMDEEMADALVGAGTEANPEVLLSAMQAGILEFLPKPVTPDSVVEALRRLERKMGKRDSEEREPGRLISVFSAKGGSGATAVATNLAVELHRLSRKRTLLVDLDLELGETALLLDMDPRFSIVDLIRNFHRVDAGLLASYIERHESGVDLLSAPYEPVDFEAVSGEQLGQILDFLKARYDYLVADVPKTFNPVTLTAFRHTDDLILLTNPDLQSLRNITRSRALLQKVNPSERGDWMRLVVNRWERNQLIPLREIEETLGMQVYAKIENDYRAVMQSINEGEPVVLGREGDSEFARGIRQLGEKLTGISSDRQTEGGILQRLMRAFRRRLGAGGVSKPSEVTTSG